MYIRRLTFIILILVAMASTSCRTTKQPIQRVHFPSREEVTVKKLTQELSSKLRIPLDEEEDNIGLYAFVADWIGVPYRYGSYSMKGTDCSGFAYQLYRQVYNINLGRSSSASMMDGANLVKRNELQEGDLVFFNINNRTGGRASHVGVYLKDDLFAHASTSQGVIISSLEEPYYRRSFLSGGRVL